MNKKMLLSAFAAVAVSAASADIFSWTLSGYGVTGETRAEIWAVPDYASSDLNSGVQIRTDKDVAQGAFASTNYRWQDGVLQAYHADKTTWYDVYRLDFTFDRDGGTASMAASWADVLAKVKTEGKYTRTMGWGTDITTLTISGLPEPTSGLMLLLGAGVLALRRRPVRA